MNIFVLADEAKLFYSNGFFVFFLHFAFRLKTTPHISAVLADEAKLFFYSNGFFVFFIHFAFRLKTTPHISAIEI